MSPQATKRQAENLGALCSQCPRLKGDGPVLAQSDPSTASMAIVGESPGYTEIRKGEPFVGPSGDFLDNILGRLRIPRHRLHITNAVMCHPENHNSAPAEWREALACCKPRLVAELSKLPRRVTTVLTYGKFAMQALVGAKGHKSIFDWCGAPLELDPALELPKRLKALPTLHPAFCLRPDGAAYVPVVFFHTQRAWMLQQKKLKAWKWPTMHIHPDKDAYEALQKMARERLPVGFDVETQGTDPMSSRCMCLALATKRCAVSVPWESYMAGKFGPQAGLGDKGYSGKIRRLVVRILDDKRIPKVFQNGPHDILTAGRLGLKVNNYAFDTLLAHAIVMQGVKHNLGFMAACEFHAPRWKQERHTASNEKGADKFAKRDPEELRTYNAKDAYMTALLAERLEARLGEVHNGLALFRDNYMTNIRVAMQMQERGVRIDQKQRAEHRVKLRKRRDQARYEVRGLARRMGMQSFNPLSHYNNAELFFNRLKVKAVKYSEKTNRPSLDAATLTDLAIHPNQMVTMAARASLRFRRWHKLLSTYIEGKKVVIGSDNIIHPTWNVHGARTFRWSSDGPNMQNIPKPVFKKLKDGRFKLVAPGMRDMYIPMESGGWIVGADYSQLELRIMALLAGDQRLLDDYAAGKDVHAENAKALFGVSTPSKQQRNMAKVAVYSMNYGGEPSSLWKVLAVDFPEVSLLDCIRMHERWFAAHHAIKVWQQEQVKMARRHSYIEAPVSGHRLIFYGQVDPQKCYNYPVQHTAADVINPAVAAVAGRLEWPREGILAQVHDELVLDGPDPVKLGQILLEEMTRTIEVAGSRMTFPVDLKASPTSWGDCEETDLGSISRLWRGQKVKAAATKTRASANRAAARAN